MSDWKSRRRTAQSEEKKKKKERKKSVKDGSANTPVSTTVVEKQTNYGCLAESLFLKRPTDFIGTANCR